MNIYNFILFFGICITATYSIDQEDQALLEETRIFITTENEEKCEKFFTCGKICYDNKLFEKAQKYFDEAAKSEHVYAMYFLGIMHQKGLGVEKNTHIARDYFERAVNSSSEIDINLRRQIYNILSKMSLLFVQKGQDIDANNAKYLQYLTQASEIGCHNAQKEMGDIYFKGKIIASDYKEAAKYYALAAAQGNAEAQNNLAIMHIKGCGVEKNYEKALSFFRNAAEQGLRNGLRGLAYMYGNGSGGVDKNLELANQLMELAKNQQKKDIFLFFAEIYEKGLGNVCADPSKAAVFYAKANP